MRVCASRLSMHFPHCVACLKYLRWLIYVCGTKHFYFEKRNAMRKRMRKREVATRLKGRNSFDHGTFRKFHFRKEQFSIKFGIK